jgi:hypothetical protein
MKEALKLALDVLERYQVGKWQDFDTFEEAITAIKAALAQQEPWCMKMNGCKTKCEDCPDYVPPAAQPAPVRDCILQEIEYAAEHGWPNASLQRLAYMVKATRQLSPAQERNFCSRCGKRTADLTVIHTCTPPQENT